MFCCHYFRATSRFLHVGERCCSAALPRLLLATCLAGGLQYCNQDMHSSQRLVVQKLMRCKLEQSSDSTERSRSVPDGFERDFSALRVLVKSEARMGQHRKVRSAQDSCGTEAHRSTYRHTNYCIVHSHRRFWFFFDTSARRFVMDVSDTPLGSGTLWRTEADPCPPPALPANL